VTCKSWVCGQMAEQFGKSLQLVPASTSYITQVHHA